MSFWDEIKELLYKPVKQDSRNMAKLGNALGWDWLEQEGKKNVGNPGRAVGKAATAAATWYLGGLAGNAAGAGGAAGGAAGAGANAAAQGAMQGIGTATTEQLMQQAIQRAAIEAAQQGAQQGALQGSGMFAGPAADAVMAGAPGLAGAAPAPATGLFAPGVSEAESLAAMEGFGGVGSHVPTSVNPTPYAPKGWFDGPDIFGKFANGTEAKRAVAEAYKNGEIGWLDMVKNTGKSDLMNMNNPSEWAARVKLNAGRLSGNAGKQLLAQTMAGGQQQQPPMAPPPRPQPQQERPIDPMLMQQVEADLKAGRISLEEAIRKLKGMA